MTRDQRICAVSIDVDSVDCYYKIHALGPSPEEHRRTAITRWLPRFIELFDEMGISATLFFVGADIADDAELAAAVKGLANAGHEIANHSYSHHYDLARRDAGMVHVEIAKAGACLSEAAGGPVCGFRAPGYDISPSMIAALQELGYLYDSSVFPAPPYYAAKALVMAGMKVLGKESGAVLTNPRALTAPTKPYRPDPKAPWRRGGSSLIEFPIGVMPFARVPAIGTSLVLAPAAVRRGLVTAMLGRRFFNLELHAVDLADAELDDIPAELVAKQPDLRVPLADKRAALAEVFAQVANSARFMPLRDVASEPALVGL